MLVLFFFWILPIMLVQAAVSFRWFKPTADSISSFVAEHFIVLVLLAFVVGFDRAAIIVGSMAFATMAAYLYYLVSRPYIRRRTNVEALARDMRSPGPVIIRTRPYQNGELYDGHH